MEYIDLDIWKKARALVKDVYKITKDFSKHELYGLTDQIRRAAVSVPSNIAEGCGRKTPKDTMRFLYISRGSLYELETQLYLALDLQYMSKTTFENIIASIQQNKKILNGFINYYKKL